METEYIHINIRKDLKERLMHEAKKRNISLNAYVNLILSKSL